MIVQPIRTCRVESGMSLTNILDDYVSNMEDGSVLALTSKVVSVCEGRVVPVDTADKAALIRRESQYYLPPASSKYGYQFTITNHTLIASAGIDQSNGNGGYILWPADAQRTADTVRQYLLDRHGLRRAGVIITDSTSTPLRLGVVGISLAHSGFLALHDYVGKPDLYGRTIAVSQANIAAGLAAGAVLAMGEGAEQTPLALLSDLPFVTFQDRPPTTGELQALQVAKEDDLFAPFLQRSDWQTGEAGA